MEIKILLSGIVVLGGTVVPYLFHLYKAFRDKRDDEREENHKAEIERLVAQLERRTEERDQWLNAYHEVIETQAGYSHSDSDSQGIEP